MPYDFAIIDDFGKPSKFISLNIDAHNRLIHKAKNIKLYLILRMEDYYSDAIYNVNEIISLKKELELMVADVETNDSEIRNFLINALSLANEAISQQKCIEGIAD